MKPYSELSEQPRRWVQLLEPGGYGQEVLAAEGIRAAVRKLPDVQVELLEAGFTWTIPESCKVSQEQNLHWLHNWYTIHAEAFGNCPR